MVLAGKGYLDEVATLLAFGADTSIQAKDGSTCLDWARRFKHEDCADLLQNYDCERKKGDIYSITEEQEIVNAYLLGVDHDDLRNVDKHCEHGHRGGDAVPNA